MAIVVSHIEIISKERIIITYHPIGKKKNIYSLFCLKKSGGYSPMSSSGPNHCTTPLPTANQSARENSFSTLLFHEMTLELGDGEL